MKHEYSSEIISLFDSDSQLIFRVQVKYRVGQRPDFIDYIDGLFPPEPGDTTRLIGSTPSDFEGY